MSTTRQFLVFLTGHRLTPDTPAEEIGSLTKIGSAIAFATLLAAIQFGIAGWFVSGNQPLMLKLMMALGCGAVGALIVLVLDRNFIYLADTRYETDKKISYFYLGIRVFLITVIGSLSSQFTMPLLLKSELAVHAQDLKDGRYKNAKEQYQQKYDLADKTKSVESLDQKIVRLKNEIKNPPQELTRKRAAADRCYQDYRQKVRNTFAPDLDESEILQLYAKEKRECDRLEGIYRAEYQAYMTPRESELAKSGEEFTQAQLAVETAKSEIERDLGKASAIHEAHINVASADVLWSLISHHPGAFFKYVLLTLLQLCLELMPIFLKIQAGQSQMGHRIALKAYEHKTRTLAQMNQSASERLASELQLEAARHAQAMTLKAQWGEQQKYAMQLTHQQLEQEMMNEKLKVQIEELKRENSMYNRIQERLGYGFRQAVDGFTNRVVVPSVSIAGIPIQANPSSAGIFQFPQTVQATPTNPTEKKVG